MEILFIVFIPRFSVTQGDSVVPHSAFRHSAIPRFRVSHPKVIWSDFILVQSEQRLLIIACSCSSADGAFRHHVIQLCIGCVGKCFTTTDFQLCFKWQLQELLSATGRNHQPILSCRSPITSDDDLKWLQSIDLPRRVDNRTWGSPRSILFARNFRRRHHFRLQLPLVFRGVPPKSRLPSDRRIWSLSCRHLDQMTHPLFRLLPWVMALPNELDVQLPRKVKLKSKIVTLWEVHGRTLWLKRSVKPIGTLEKPVLFPLIRFLYFWLFLCAIGFNTEALNSSVWPEPLPG